MSTQPHQGTPPPDWPPVVDVGETTVVVSRITDLVFSVTVSVSLVVLVLGGAVTVVVTLLVLVFVFVVDDGVDVDAVCVVSVPDADVLVSAARVAVAVVFPPVVFVNCPAALDADVTARWAMVPAPPAAQAVST